VDVSWSVKRPGFTPLALLRAPRSVPSMRICASSKIAAVLIAWIDPGRDVA
jgi:hypothetical protein